MDILRREYLSNITKPERRMKDLHNKSISFLCKNFKTILLGDF